MNVWQAAADLARQSGSGALATVARARGSTPVPAGTKMLVGAEGRLIGSIGGGCVEGDVLDAAAAAEAGLVRTATDWSQDGPQQTFEPLARAGFTGAAATITRDGRFMEERLLTAPRVF